MLACILAMAPGGGGGAQLSMSLPCEAPNAAPAHSDEAPVCVVLDVFSAASICRRPACTINSPAVAVAGCEARGDDKLQPRK